MRKMYSEEQIKAIANKAVADAFAELGISLNNQGEIKFSRDVVLAAQKKIITPIIETGQLSGIENGDLEITTGGGGMVNFTAYENNFSGQTFFGWDNKEAMGIMWTGTFDNPYVSMLPNGGSLNVLDTNTSINFESESINMPNVPDYDPAIGGRIWNDSQTAKFGTK
ncbi:MAG: hypothetical protein J6Y28_02600 [Acholeplasmatales bacterium]|nr:hypothetical protein [Acholeplasmatales bacterium]